jgi:hypothetical protein
MKKWCGTTRKSGEDSNQWFLKSCASRSIPGGVTLMPVNRREFLGITPGSRAGSSPIASGVSDGGTPASGKGQYRYRLAFDIWANDVRNEAMTLANWPYGDIDDKTVDGIMKALDVQSEAGYNMVDPCGFWATYSWPIDIHRMLNRDRDRRINRILKAAHERNIKVITFPCGIMNWGFDEIIEHDPAVRSDNKHNMNPLREESWQWAYKIFDFVMDNYDFDGFHLESADQGRCKTQECMQKWPNNVGYHCFVTGTMADHVRKKYPGKIVMATIQSFAPYGQTFSEEEKAYLVELSKHIDCLFDQGHAGTYIPQKDWAEFIPQIHCPYGTSGGIWIYTNQRWERTRWFLPYALRTGKHIQDLYKAGGQGVMFYQGPGANPGMELNMAFGGRIMTKMERSIEDVLGETLESLYRPKNAGTQRKLVAIFQLAENVYFDQWNKEKIHEVTKRPAPGNFHITNSFGASPGASEYLMEPFLDTMGRLKYKRGLIDAYKGISEIDRDFDDQGRIDRIKRSIGEALVDINNIAMCKGEAPVWDDQTMGLRY